MSSNTVELIEIDMAQAVRGLFVMRCVIYILILLFGAFHAAYAFALEINSKFNPESRLFPASISVNLSGEIVMGDAAALAASIAGHHQDNVETIYFNWNSGGGNLVEGIKLGQLISSLPYRSTYAAVSVGGTGQQDAICASACVFGYLGAQYRSLHDGGRIGVHKFYSSNEDIKHHDALSTAQTLSGMIVSYLNDRAIDSRFFDDILSAEGDQMFWVPLPRLIEMRVVNDGVSNESVEYMNVNGGLVLRIQQSAGVGKNVLRLFCGGNGLSGVAFLMEPPDAVPTDFALTVGDVEFPVRDAVIISRENFITSVGFLLPPEAVVALGAASSVGAYFYTGPYMFYGFQGEIIDPKISEMAQSCNGGISAPVYAPSFSRASDVDIRGGDLTINGYRNVSLNECEAICLRTRSCVAVSYVIDKQWCWPKGPSGTPVSGGGITSSILAE